MRLLYLLIAILFSNHLASTIVVKKRTESPTPLQQDQLIKKSLKRLQSFKGSIKSNYKKYYRGQNGYKEIYDDIYYASLHCIKSPCDDALYTRLLIFSAELDELDPNIQLGYEYLALNYKKNKPRFKKIIESHKSLKKLKEKIITTLEYQASQS